jgi:hypothetical protein
MKIDITKEQYKMLAKAVMIADDVYGILGDEVSEEYKKESNEFEEFRKYILGHAKDFGCENLVEKYRGEIIPSDDFSEEMDVVVDAYDDETFWHELETRLGKRDFERDMTKEERKQAEKDGCYPNKIWDYYEKYQKEFEEHGTERLEIQKDENAN